MTIQKDVVYCLIMLLSMAGYVWGQEKWLYATEDLSCRKAAEADIDGKIVEYLQSLLAEILKVSEENIC